MSVRQTIQIGHPSLQAENKPIADFSDPKVKQVICDLRDTMMNEGLIGMAAPQIAENYQIFVTEPRETDSRPKDQSDIFRVYINPRIVKFSRKKTIIFEGCGSVLHGELFGPVLRPKQITIHAFDEKGKKFRLICDGILARVIQHECDHLDQTEFIENVFDYKELMVKEYYVQNERNSFTTISASKISVIKQRKIL